MVLKVQSGYSFAPKQAEPCPCPNCGTKVFDQYPKGFVNEINIVTTQSSNGWNVRENWSCPGCGHKEPKYHEVTPDGRFVNRKANSSQVSKPRKRSKK